MTTAARIVNALLDSDAEVDFDPGEIFRSAVAHDLIISDKPSVTDGRKVYTVRLKTELGNLPIGTIYQDTHWGQGWTAYEVYSQKKRDYYAGRYYVGQTWFSSPQEAAAKLRAHWEKT